MWWTEEKPAPPSRTKIWSSLSLSQTGALRLDTGNSIRDDWIIKLLLGKAESFFSKVIISNAKTRINSSTLWSVFSCCRISLSSILEDEDWLHYSLFWDTYIQVQGLISKCTCDILSRLFWNNIEDPMSGQLAKKGRLLGRIFHLVSSWWNCASQWGDYTVWWNCAPHHH